MLTSAAMAKLSRIRDLLRQDGPADPFSRGWPRT